jgi:hypothetical protein
VLDHVDYDFLQRQVQLAPDLAGHAIPLAELAHPLAQPFDRGKIAV